MTNYNEKITEISIQILEKFKILLVYIKELIKDRETSKGGDKIGIPIKTNEVNKVDTLINPIKKLINDFEYYTKFYPNKESIWKKQIEQIDYIKHIIEQISIDK